MTKLEKRIVRRRACVVFGWLFCGGLILSQYWLNWIWGIFATVFYTPVLIAVGRMGGCYIPKFDYFKVCRDFSRQEKQELSEQCIDQKSTLRFREISFTEEFVVFTKFGAVLRYTEIESIKWKEGWICRSNTPIYTMIFKIEAGPTYKLDVTNDDSFFRGENSLFNKVKEIHRSKRIEVTNLLT